MKKKLPRPVDGSYDKRFGRRHKGGKLKWEGDAFYAPIGTPIQSIHHGRVDVSPGGGCGQPSF